MKKLVTAAGLIVASSFCLTIVSVEGLTAPLESVIDAIGIKISQDHANTSWEDAANIKRVKWQWPYYESGSHDSTMIGKTKIGKSKNPNVGETEIRVEGSTKPPATRMATASTQMKHNPAVHRTLRDKAAQRR